MTQSEKAPKPTAQVVERENRRLREENERLKREIERLRGELEKATRAGKRQAAPFSRGEPKKQPKRPGRKAGAKCGRQGRRPVPAHVDEVKAAALPAQCPCGGCVKWERNETQYQEDIECRTVRRRFDVAIGQCQRCAKRVQGRHPEQTSDGLGAAGVQIGPRALGLAAVMTKQMGLSLGHTVRILRQGFGLTAQRSTISRAMMRLGRKGEPAYQQMLRSVRSSAVNEQRQQEALPVLLELQQNREPLSLDLA